jgi:hypothetical protein
MDLPINPLADRSRGVKHLDVNRRARRGIGICRARGEYTKGPVIFSVLVCNAIDRDFLHVMTAGLLSHF